MVGTHAEWLRISKQRFELRKTGMFLQYAPKLVSVVTTMVIASALGLVLRRQTQDASFYSSFCQALPTAANITYRSAEYNTEVVEVRTFSESI